MAGGRGIVYVAYGNKAKEQMKFNYRALQQAGMDDIPVTVIDENVFPQRDRGARWSKLNLDTLSPYDHTLYLDADTRVRADIRVGFEILADGFDLVIVPSSAQGSRLFGHIGEDERERTFEVLGNPWPLQLQGGVFWFVKSEPVLDLFAAWREEWERYEDQDQAALLRALDRVANIKVWLLSSSFNSGALNQGALVEHYFGRARG
jgi:hypothetical protein